MLSAGYGPVPLNYDTILPEKSSGGRSRAACVPFGKAAKMRFVGRPGPSQDGAGLPKHFL